MDIFCPVCGEPVDIDSLHDETQDRLVFGPQYEAVFKEVQADFRKRGCEALKFSHGDTNIMRASAAAALFEIMPDDFDGVASMMEDAGF